MTATSDSLLLRIEHETLDQVLGERAEFARALIRFLCRRFRKDIATAHHGK